MPKCIVFWMRIVPYLPEEKPTYLMGVGTPENILEAVERGVDFFDCVLPARNGRHAHVYTNKGKLNLLNAKYEKDDSPIDDTCGLPCVQKIQQSLYPPSVQSKGNACHAPLCDA